MSPISTQTRLVLATASGILGTLGLAALGVSILGAAVICVAAVMAGYVAWKDAA